MSEQKQNFFCYPCKFSCTRQSNYDMHCKTKKHLKKVSVTGDVDPCTVCLCGKSYVSKYTLKRHMSKCKIILQKQKDEEVKELKKKHEEEMNELKKELKNKEQPVAQTINNNYDNKTINNIQNIHNHFNLNFYLNDTCKDAINLTDFVESIQLQLKDLENMGKLGYVEGISNIIVKELNNMDKEKRPIHCSDERRNVLYIKDEDGWDKDVGNQKVEDAVEKIERKNFKQLNKWVQENPSAKNGMTQKGEEYHKIIQESFGNDKPAKLKKVIKNIVRAVPVKDDDENS